MSEQSTDEMYEKVLEDIKKVYKPRLKNMSKNKLIDLVVEMSAQVAALRTQKDIEDDKAQKEL